MSSASVHADLRVRGESAADWVRRCATNPVGDAVVFHAPSFAFQTPGGGENQLIQTGRHLELLGVPVHLFSPWTDRLASARLLHLFGMSREGLELARIARRQGIPVALSTIAWFDAIAMLRLADDPVRGAIDAAKWSLKRLVPRLPSWRGELIELADVLLPNSRAEADQLIRLFGADPRKIQPIPNGVEDRFAEADPGLFRASRGDEPFILYVGRIEPRKNVATLIRAARIAGLRLVVMGGIPSGREDYAAHCRSLGEGFVDFMRPVAHDDPMLASAYAASRVFALPSWFETPGLAALEAVSAGAAAVITPVGCTREYFGDDAIYAPPQSATQIARALSIAWSEGPRPGAATRVTRQFHWSEAARRTAEAYDDVLK